MEHVAEEDIEPLGQDPGALVLDDPVLHLPEPLLLFPRAQGHDRPHQVLEVFDVLKYFVFLLPVKYFPVLYKMFFISSDKTRQPGISSRLMFPVSTLYLHQNP